MGEEDEQEEGGTFRFMVFERLTKQVARLAKQVGRLTKQVARLARK